MNYKIGLSIVWLLFTISLVFWWWTFSLTHLQPEWRNMFYYEGLFLMAVIVGGGASLIIFSYRDQKRSEQFKVFLSTFSHDVKTAISRLRIKTDLGQFEGINEQMQILELQLENALLLSTFEKSLFLKEDVQLSQVISDMRPLFPDLTFHVSRDCRLIVDKRVFINALRNFLQNSVLHGKASVLNFKVGTLDKDRVQIEISDNGIPFKGSIENLGKKIVTKIDHQSASSTSGSAAASTSGSGIGLYLSRILLEKIGGTLAFSLSDKNQFLVQVKLPGQVL